jgi:hypothetical protein
VEVALAFPPAFVIIIASKAKAVAVTKTAVRRTAWGPLPGSADGGQSISGFFEVATSGAHEPEPFPFASRGILDPFFAR